MRVLVTGSRTWKDGTRIHAALQECLDEAVARRQVLTVVHGACRSGADAHADRWARWQWRHGRPVAEPETHPAKWDAPCRVKCHPGHRRPDHRGWDVCPQAGFYRNEAMVGLGADLCLAFIADSSRGATHCAEKAKQAGIRTVIRRNTDVSEPAPTLF